MKRHFVFLTFIFSFISAFGAFMNSDWPLLIAWLTAAIASLDHFFTLRHFD